MSVKHKYIITYKLDRQTSEPGLSPHLSGDNCYEVIRKDTFVTYAVSEKQAINNLRFRGIKEYSRELSYDTREDYYIDKIEIEIK